MRPARSQSDFGGFAPATRFPPAPSERSSTEATFSWGLLFSSGQVERARAVSQLLNRRAGFVENRQKQVRHRRLIWERQIPACLELAAKLAGKQAWQVEVAV